MWLTAPQHRLIATVLTCLVPAALSAEGAPPAPPQVPGNAAPKRDGLPPADLLALRGFDAVSYRLPGGPVAGKASLEWSWRGRVWRFATAGNRDAFRRDPAAYAPRLGAYDPLGVAENRLVDADPLIFAVVGDRLYLFRDAGRRARALSEPDLTRQAEARWPGLRTLTDAAPPD
ncbi:YHS domain-containing (seleno)protein [Methylobacterium nigriterrae]|uniref:YHS domain-containing (seleno)protein n=1 Tax=Methylobacterium nigriterrae TaxID=3127512 RepID=UPI0030135B0E